MFSTLRNAAPVRRCAICVLCSTLSSAAFADTGASDPNSDEHHYFDEIIVSAIPLERTVEQLAQPTSVIDGDDLARQQAASIGESLANEPGVSSSYFGPVASRPIIRGQGGERVTVLSNGLDSLDASALSEDHATSTDPILAERVEIVRGPATLLYGSGAAGGLVNVVDSRIQDRIPEVPLSGAISLGSDAATGRQSGAARFTANSDGLIFYADVFRRETDNIEIPGFAESALLRALEEEEEHGDEEEEHEEEEEAFGIVENTDSETRGGSAAISYVGERGFFGVSVSQYDTNYGIPGHGHHEEEEHGDEEEEEHGEEEEIIRIDLDQTRVDARGSLTLDGPFEALNVKLANNRYEHVELEGDEIGTMFENDAMDLRVDLKQQTVGSLSGSIGLQYKNVDFNAVGEEAFVPPSETTSISLFTFQEWQLNPDWVLQASGRIEQLEISAPNLPGYDDTAFGASIGAIWSYSDELAFSANLAITERHPNSTELYANGPHLAVERFELGFVTTTGGFLDKELSTNVDLTVRGDYDRFQWSVTGFLNNIDDYILLSPTAAEEDELQVFEFQQADAQLYGVEAELLVDLLEIDDRHLHARLFTDFVQAEERGSGAYLPRITPFRYGAGLHFTANRLDASVRVTVNEEQDNIASFELPTESFTLVDAEVSYRGSENLLLFARGTNLGDEDARRHTSSLKDITPLPGRSLQLGLRWDF